MYELEAGLTESDILDYGVNIAARLEAMQRYLDGLHKTALP